MKSATITSSHLRHRRCHSLAACAAVLVAVGTQAVNATPSFCDQEPTTVQPGQTTPPATAPPAEEAQHAEEARSDADAISRTLARYAKALSLMDADAAVKEWPFADRRALSEAFKSLESNSVAYDACAIEIGAAGSAIATCRATVQYVAKIGPRGPHVTRQQWRFLMSKVGEDWKIQTASAIEDR